MADNEYSGTPLDVDDKPNLNGQRLVEADGDKILIHIWPVNATLSRGEALKMAELLIAAVRESS